ncbi:MAG: DNA adenine methylase [Candidatus Anammoxibacter sp.]
MVSNTKQVKSPVSQMGGKYFLSQWLNSKVPAHRLYCEPFCGGGHLLFHKEPSQVEILNDINNNLITFYQVLQDDLKRERLVNLLNGMAYSRRIFRDLSTRWKLGDIPFNDVLKASEWFYLSRTCFSGDFHRGGFSVPSVTGRNPCVTFRNITDSLDDISKRLRCVTFENLNYAECIQKYDSPGSLFYCDPPYINVEGYYGKDCFINDDHYKLAEILHSAIGKVMITHYKNDIYGKLYEGWNRFEYESFKVSRGITKSNNVRERPKTLEVLYCNFDYED